MGCKKTVTIKIRLTKTLFIAVFGIVMPLISFIKKTKCFRLLVKEMQNKKILILDCISKSQSLDLEEASNVIYLESVSSLTIISLAITASIQQIPGDKFVFIDSINSMLIHNKPEVFAQFIHGILTKLRIGGVNGLLISLENETNKEIHAEVAQLCDRIVKI
jgi:hypothetical protein